MGRYPTTLAVELKLSQVTLEAFNETLKLCTGATSKEFVNVLDLQEKPPKGLDPEEQWLWVDPVKKSGWTHRTANDAVVRYRTVKVQAWDAVAPTEFSTNRRLRTHVPFVNRPFESEIHGTVNFTQFCCFLLVTWCYRVLLSCYLRPK